MFNYGMFLLEDQYACHAIFQTGGANDQVAGTGRDVLDQQDHG